MSPVVNGAEVPLDKIAGSRVLTEAQKVEEMSRQFEAVFLRQILSQARRVLHPSKFESESATSGLYNDMITSQLADSISRSGDFGLATSLQAQLNRQLLTEVKSEKSEVTSQNSEVRSQNSDSSPSPPLK